MNTKMDAAELKEIFGKFAGREVPVVESVVTLNLSLTGPIDVPEIKLADESDTTVAEMTGVALANSLTLRLKWKSVGYTGDYKKDRVNAHIEKGTDGKWRVADKFYIG